MGYSYLRGIDMSKLSEKDKKHLLSNSNVEKVTDSHVVFTSEFKIKAVKANLEGRRPADIFKDAKIDICLFQEDFPKKSVARWRKIYLENGEDGLSGEKRGKGATGRPKSKKFSSLEAELKYLRMENDFLKKLHALADLKEKKSSK